MDFRTRVAWSSPRRRGAPAAAAAGSFAVRLPSEKSGAWRRFSTLRATCRPACAIRTRSTHAATVARACCTCTCGSPPRRQGSLDAAIGAAVGQGRGGAFLDLRSNAGGDYPGPTALKTLPRRLASTGARDPHGQHTFPRPSSRACCGTSPRARALIGEKPATARLLGRGTRSSCPTRRSRSTSPPASTTGRRAAGDAVMVANFSMRWPPQHHPDVVVCLARRGLPSGCDTVLARAME